MTRATLRPGLLAAALAWSAAAAAGAPWIEREFTRPASVPVEDVARFLNEECRPADLSGIQTVGVQKGHEEAMHLHVYCRKDGAAGTAYRVSMATAPRGQAFARISALAADPRARIGPFHFGEGGDEDGVLLIERTR